MLKLAPILTPQLFRRPTSEHDERFLYTISKVGDIRVGVCFSEKKPFQVYQLFALVVKTWKFNEAKPYKFEALEYRGHCKALV